MFLCSSLCVHVCVCVVWWWWWGGGGGGGGQVCVCVAGQRHVCVCMCVDGCAHVCVHGGLNENSAQMWKTSLFPVI